MGSKKLRRTAGHTDPSLFTWAGTNGEALHLHILWNSSSDGKCLVLAVGKHKCVIMLWALLLDESILNGSYAP